MLLVTGLGKSNAMMAVSALLGWKMPTQNDTLINVGLCAAPKKYPLGEPLLIHQIIDTHRRFYPDILYTHPLDESSIVCADAPQSTPLDTPVDMESSGVFQAASKFFKLHQMAFLKIVSDHFEPEQVNKEKALALVQTHTGTIDTLAKTMQNLCSVPPLFTAEERAAIEMLKHHFTVSQGSALEDALCYARLKNPLAKLEITLHTLPNTKRERSELHEYLIQTLIS
jgi:hypothetical protein